MTKQRFGDRGGRSKFAMGEISLGLAYDGELHHHLVGDVLELYLVQHLHLVGTDLGAVDNLCISNHVLKVCNLKLKESLSIAGRIVLGILGKVSLFTGLGDSGRNDGPLGEGVSQVFLQFFKTFLRHIVNFCHNYNEIIL